MSTQVGEWAVLIGQDVYYFSRVDFAERYEQPRLAKVLGPGGGRGMVNLGVFCDPLVDIQIGHKAPMLSRRNIAILDAMPDQWPMDDFCVPIHVVQLQVISETWTPHGGKRPQVIAGYPQPAPTKWGDGMAKYQGIPMPMKAALFAPDASQADQASSAVPEKMKNGPAGGGMTNSIIDQVPTSPRADIPTVLPPTRPGDPNVSGYIQRVLNSPTFMRSWTSAEAKGAKHEAIGDALRFMSKHGIILAEIHNKEPHGFTMYVQTAPKGKGKKAELIAVAEKVKSNEQGRLMIVTACRTAEEGAEAKTPTDAAKAYKAAQEAIVP